ncbi:MAG TPA: PH domain-containing protein [Geopsychrobacteraceae bacterium]|nr:PH domain-containing protein [Geopsychrobacteraceae bacterium]
MDWQQYLQKNERILWQGRPAPRCYTFRNWKPAVFGLVLFLASSFWLMLGLQLMKDGFSPALTLIPLPLVVVSFMLGPGQVLLARIEWEHLYYCLTDQKLLIQSGVLRNQVRAISRTEIAAWQQKRYGQQLASIRIELQTGKHAVFLHCLEQPQIFLDLLECHNRVLRPLPTAEETV